jgi:hypothetical protein
MTLQVWEDMFHVWQSFAPRRPAGVQAMAAIGGRLDRPLGPVVTSDA